MNHALIVDDDADSARMMATLIGDEGFSSATARSLGDARAKMARQSPDLLLLDLELPDGSGISLLHERELLARSEVVLMAGHAEIGTSIEALRHGAADCLIKPVSPRQLRGILSRVAHGPAVRLASGGELHRAGRFGHLVGRSASMLGVYEQLGRVAATSITVLITGESGTGKELAARTLHDLSRRRDRPFLAVNCGAISPHLMESEIFGHEKGSFTGAERLHQGFFERAHGGTLFLDEITELPPALQVKLLRVLETGTFMRVGSTVAQETDVRIVAASNRDPLHAVREGDLREDLYYRLNVFPLHMPPLRDRLDDLPLMVTHILQEIGQREGAFKRATPAALERLGHYRWPGNVRELRNVLQRAWVMARDDEISPQWLPRDELADAWSEAAGQRLQVPLGASLAAVERQVILATLAHYGQHKERTAAALGVSLKTLYNRLREYGQ